MTFGAFRLYEWTADKELGRSLFGNFSARTGEGESTTDSEAKALVELAASPPAAKKAFLAAALETGENARRLSSHRFALAIALSQANSGTANELYQSVIRGSLSNPKSDPTALEGDTELMRFWDTAPSLSGSEAQKLAATLVERMSQEKDADALRSLAYGLGALDGADLTGKQLAQISWTFQQHDASCSALLAFDRATQRGELPKQLRNPLCREDDWKQLALRAAKLTGQPIAEEKEVNGRKVIEVSFPKVSEYVWSGQRWYEQYRLSFPEIAALVLLILAAGVFTLGLIRSRDQRVGS